MAEDNMQEHLNSALYGPPQTKPDERRKYMGSLRERSLYVSAIRNWLIPNDSIRLPHF